MRLSNIRTVIALGVSSLVIILLIQFYWIDISLKQQKEEIRIQQQQDSLNTRQFNDKVFISLKNVAQEILTINKDTADLYGAVKQVSTNYFTVNINDTLHPYLLERILIREFEKRNIKDDFQYGIYDCFTDSIVYGNFIGYNSNEIQFESIDTSNIDSPQIKWDSDGHYFSVLFPNLENNTIDVSKITYEPWFYALAIVVFVMLFFSYAINVILQQKRLSEIKTDFINNMTHELKTPISTISLSSENLMNKEISKDADKVSRYAGIIYKENKRLEKQVEQVLKVAKLDKQKLKIDKEETDIQELIKDTAQHFNLAMEKNGGRIHFQFSTSNPLVEVDPVHFSNVIFNLIDNAIKYCSIEPDIEISTKVENGKYNIDVKDNGTGIKKEVQKYIFDKFYRVPTGNLHDVKGFGLGLYYVKLIVDAHNGKISLKSQPGKGSTFSITLGL